MRSSLCVLLLATVAGAQSPVTAPAPGTPTAPPDSTRQAMRPASYVPPVGPPIRQISTASAISKEKLGSINGVRELPDGRVLLNDGTSRRLLLLDTNLVLDRVVLDSMSEHANTYGNRQGSIIPQRGDSTLFVDQNSMSMLVLDPQGNIARVRSVPKADHVYMYAQTSNPVGTDARGRIVYRMWAEPARPTKAPPRGVPWFPLPPDSSFIVALDMETRKIDTLGSYKIPKEDFTVRVSPNGGWNFTNNINPLPATDDWAVLPDGSIGVVRAIDYRVDYRNPDGTWTSSPKLPFDWRPMPDSAKRALVDSVRNAQMKSSRNNYTNSLIRWVNTYQRKYPANFKAPDGFVPTNGYQKAWTMPPNVVFPPNYIYGCAPGEEPVITPDSTSTAAAAMSPEQARAMEMMMSMGITPPPGMMGNTRGRPSCIPQPIPNTASIPQPPQLREVGVIPWQELPSFRPPIAMNAVRADMDGNLWIRFTPPRPIPGGPVFDIVNREGQLVDRLQTPPGYTIVGFGRGRVVYLQMRDREGIHLARVRLR
jgi:hypothetical protein